MIPLPQPPTDNLYKFGFISGLLLFVMGIVLPTLIEHDHIDALYRASERMRDRTNDMYWKSVDSMYKNPDLKDEEAKRKWWAGNMAEWKSVVEAEGKGFTNEFGRRREIAEQKMFFLTVGMYIGLLLALVSGWFWYYRVQKQQDQLLKAQVAEALLKSVAQPAQNQPAGPHTKNKK